MTLGNVIFDGEIPYNYGFIKKYSYDDKAGIDTSVPTLYIGYTETKKELGPFNPLNKNINDKVMWTYKPTEQSKDFQQDLFNFTIGCCKTYISDYEYCFVNLFNKIERNYYLTKLLNYKKDLKILFTNKDSLYVVLGKEIFGFSYRVMKYIGLDCRGVLNHLKKNDYKVFTEKDVSPEGVTLALLLDDERWKSLFI